MSGFTLEQFNDMHISSTDNTQDRVKAVNIDELEKNKPYMMTEWREIVYTKDGQEKVNAIGTLKDDTQVWLPKSMKRKIENKEGPYMFVYRGRKSDKWRTYNIDVLCGDVLRAKGIVKDDEEE